MNDRGKSPLLHATMAGDMNIVDYPLGKGLILRHLTPKVTVLRIALLKKDTCLMDNNENEVMVKVENCIHMVEVETVGVENYTRMVEMENSTYVMEVAMVMMVVKKCIHMVETMMLVVGSCIHMEEVATVMVRVETCKDMKEEEMVMLRSGFVWYGGGGDSEGGSGDL
ncbi:uncharacterized protein LOC113318424 isoform X1 [Papaver somniferum]|uniref:uncharacterized protein LOC113318424 isoform X1 n=1 Tax=Papaver somniferum TaxID=3469 RepID=UPI000E703D76|nr:uncharacterized protein LOC113318424 isoform X1 [Papaver somniferum]XP_026422379.1 uncharacterized protein LOC113318424 isoform X1 [Papaver somniferum]